VRLAALAAILIHQTGSLTIGRADTVTIGVPDANAQLTFSSSAGQTVSLRATDATVAGLFVADGDDMESA
jgi:hypothetical protein